MTAQPQPPTWNIRAYRAGDERALVALFAQVFGRPISAAHWQWKLKQQPSPVENVWLAVHDDTPIFQYAGIPQRYRLPGGESVAMVSVDTMTAPDFRRRGLLSSVGQHSYDAWRAAGIPFVIGLPNQQWGSRTQALGWQKLFSLEWLVRPLRPEAILARRAHVPALARLSPVGALWNGLWSLRAARDTGVCVRELARAGAECDQLWQQYGPRLVASVVRDSAWVNWRYLDAPSFAYTLLLAERAGQALGYAAYRVAQTDDATVGFIAELFAPAPDAGGFGALLGTTLKRLHAAGADRALTLAIPGTALYHQLRRAGFLRMRGAFSVEIVPLAADLPIERLRDPNQWSMAGGDFDVI